MQADRELIAELRALKKKWLYASTDESDNADRLFHECSSSEAGGRCRGKQEVHIACAQELDKLLKLLDV